MEKLSAFVVGRRCGYWTILALSYAVVGRSRTSRLMARCRCDCGRVRNVQVLNLRSGASQSCGCRAHDAQTRLTHEHRARLIGRRFHRWTILAIAQEAGRPYARCQCRCGRTKDVSLYSVVHGLSKSCGCLSGDSARARFTTHKRSNTPEYRTWAAAKTRCYNRRTPSYADYGARGIKMCDKWRDDFAAFFRDMGPKPSPVHSLERIDNDGPYAPENCEWAVKIVQANNNRRSRHIEFNGKRRTLAQWLADTRLPKQIFLLNVIDALTAENKRLRSRRDHFPTHPVVVVVPDSLT